MRSDLSKSLKLNSAESGCLEGESREERVACSVNAGGNAAYKNRSSLTKRRSSKILLIDVERDKQTTKEGSRLCTRTSA